MSNDDPSSDPSDRRPLLSGDRWPIIDRLERGLLRMSQGLSRRLLARSKTGRADYFERLAEPYCIHAGDEVFILNTADKIISKEIYAAGEFDLKKFFKACDLLQLDPSQSTFVDCGANMGCICVPLVGRKIVSHAIAIEPDPENYRLLIANIHLNNLQNRISSVQRALGADDG